jgi:hypothetical protein
VSALLSTALESMTLPSRLRAKNGLRTTLDEIAGALNINGNQKVAKLQMSIGSKTKKSQLFQLLPNGQDRQGRLEVRGNSRDPRVPSTDGRGDVEAVEEDTPVNLDMDFFPSDEPSQSRGRRLTKKIHIFGEAENLRGDDLLGSDVEADDYSVDGRDRARRRAAGLKIIQKLVSNPIRFSVRRSQLASQRRAHVWRGTMDLVAKYFLSYFSLLPAHWYIIVLDIALFVEALSYQDLLT